MDSGYKCIGIYSPIFHNSNLRFADEIDGLAGEEDEFRNLVKCLDEKSRAAGMEISAEKLK